ncbi:NlpC/P60 family protein [Salaquimonas pukyongi]|uniref:C40 family peptidase n=1 Tax=Salaquimonas pukyongi TaxID=2712698 RepID=UPI00096BC31F|nr:NlpC/P60 family protein [Salaquimonas pukyongi]
MNRHQPQFNWPEIRDDDPRLYLSQSEKQAAEPAWISGFFADVKRQPQADAGLDTQLLHGENVLKVETGNGWAKIQARRNGYVGWILEDVLGEGERSPSHHVSVPRTFLYPGPDMKLPRSGYRSLGSGAVVVGKAETRGTRYAILDSGEAIIEDHLVAVGNHAEDYVSVAETLLRTPYLWGGSTAFGIDCSGLVSLAMQMAGIDVLRDSDMQAATIGEPVAIDPDWSNLWRGDLVFWRGHVAIAQGEIGGLQHLLHANGHTMDVTSEPADEAVRRIAHLYETPIGVRRPASLGKVASS